jgi:hypothetical protein
MEAAHGSDLEKATISTTSIDTEAPTLNGSPASSGRFPIPGSATFIQNIPTEELKPEGMVGGPTNWIVSVAYFFATLATLVKTIAWYTHLSHFNQH